MLELIKLSLEILREFITTIGMPTINLIVLLSVSKIGQDYARKQLIGSTLEEDIKNLQDKVLILETEKTRADLSVESLAVKLLEAEDENKKLIRIINEN